MLQMKIASQIKMENHEFVRVTTTPLGSNDVGGANQTAFLSEKMIDTHMPGKMRYLHHFTRAKLPVAVYSKHEILICIVWTTSIVMMQCHHPHMIQGLAGRKWCGDYQ